MQQLIETWAQQWGIPPAAMQDLRARLLVDCGPIADRSDEPRTSEAYIQSEIRMYGGKHNVLLWRNNKGVLPNPQTGIPVRFGLCNDNKQIGATYSSADLIGIRRVLITPAHVGHVIGQFASIEAKAASGGRVGEGQRNWCTLVNAWGGWAKISNTPAVFTA